MRNFLFCAATSVSLLLAGCEETQGTQIGNEGVVTETPTPGPTNPTTCEARSLAGSTQLPGWPGTLDEVAASLLAGTIAVTLDTDGSTATGSMRVQASGFRTGDDGDCDHITVGVSATVDLGDALDTVAAGRLLIPASSPSRAEGVLEADAWTGDLLRAPEVDQTLVFDTLVTVSGLESDVVLQTCPPDTDCSEEVIGLLTSDPT